MFSRFCGSAKPQAGRLDDQYPPDQHPMNQGVREEAKTASFPAQTVATEPHAALRHADITGKEGQRCQPRDQQSPTFLRSPELLPVLPLLTRQLLGKGNPGVRLSIPHNS